MKELALIEGLNTELAVIDSKKLAKISQRMVEIDRANMTVGKQNTQATSQLMTLTMMCDAPYRRLRQVLAQIERTRTALEEQAFKLKKDKIRLERYRESDDDLKQVRADEIEHKMHRSKMYVEASLKQLATFQEVYEEIKETHNIPDNWDEMDLEKEEISNHVRMAFRNGVRNIMTTGTLNAGTLEYLEQFGIHPVTALHLIKDYLESCDQLKSEGKMPTVDHFYNFLDECAETFKDCHKAVMRRIGIKDLIKDEYIFQEMRDAV